MASKQAESTKLTHVIAKNHKDFKYGSVEMTRPLQTLEVEWQTAKVASKINAPGKDIGTEGK